MKETVLGPSTEVPGQLEGPDAEILRLLAREGRSTLAFQGLRKRMKIHQEKLSRALRRLEADELIQKTPQGYTPTPKGAQVAQQWMSPPGSPLNTLLEAYLPGDVSPDRLAFQLQGRWFGNLRWLGTVEESGKLVLRWVTEGSGAEVRVNLTWGRMTVETDATDGPPLAEAFQGMQMIFTHLGPLGGSSGGVRHLFLTN